MPSVENIAATHTAAANTQLQSQIGIAVVGKQLDAHRAAGNAAIKLLESAVALSKEIGLGDAYDARA